MSIAKITKSPEEWKNELPQDVYEIAFDHGTETPGSSPLNYNKESGIYMCAVCGLELFSSEAKYESGTGWPSFYQPIKEENVETSTDFKLGYPRMEVHCARCGAHLGHVFSDGPIPTGQRFCMNGTVLKFEKGEGSA